jgi:hypothetical protein
MYARYKKHNFWAAYASRRYVRIINCIRQPPSPSPPFLCTVPSGEKWAEGAGCPKMVLSVRMLYRATRPSW